MQSNRNGPVDITPLWRAELLRQGGSGTSVLTGTTLSLLSLGILSNLDGLGVSVINCVR